MAPPKAGEQHFKLEQVLLDAFTTALATQSGRPAAIRRILMPTDFSPSSLHALPYAEELARRCDAELVVLFVDFSPSIYDRAQDDDPAPKRALEQAAAALRARQIRARGVYRRGAAEDEIVRAAATDEADLIVMGTHGRTGLTFALMGSVAESVARHAGCPVMTIRGPAPAA